MRGINPSTPPRATPQAGLVPARAGKCQPFIFPAFLNHNRAGASHMQAVNCFVPGWGHETNLRRDETIFRVREGRLKRTLGISWLTKTTGPPRPSDRGPS